MIFRMLASVFIGVLLSLFIVPVASAHSTEPRVEISMERLHPGQVVDVRGVSFGMDEIVTLTLIGSGVEVPLGEMLADAEGEFKYIAVLPTDLAEGPYYFRAVTSHHFVLSPPLTVWGTAMIENHDQGPRDEDDGLLAPMPTFPPAVATAPVVPAAETPPASPASNSNLIILSLVFLMGIIFVVGLSLKKRTN